MALPTGGVETRTYDALGQVASRTLPYGTTMAFSYDIAGRLTTRITDDGEGPQSYIYGPQGRLDSSSSDVGTNTYSYDSAGRLSGFVNPHGQEIGYEYDVLGRTSAVQVRESATALWIRTEYGYDAAGNMTSVTEPDGDTATFTYDAGDRLISRTLPNGVQSTWSYDIGGRVTSVSHAQSDGTVIVSRDYTRLDSGEPTRIVRQDGSARNLTLDAAGRIETENIDDGSGSLNTARRYAYDGDGNRTLRVLDEGTVSEIAETSTLAAGSELSSIARTGASTDADAFTYDDAGRLTQLVRGGVTYDLMYSADDELVRIDKDGVLAFEATFDAEGRRVGTRHHGPLGTTERRFLIAASLGTSYNSPHLVTDELGALQASYVYAGEHALSRIEGASETYYLRDALGTVIATVDEAGVVLGRYDYDAFGNSIGAAPTSSSSAGEFAFQGMWLDAGVLGELSLYYVRARMYDVSTGRFVTRDPAEGRMQRPETYWSYAFGNGNPEWATDPSGRISLFSVAAAHRIAFGLLAAGWYLEARLRTNARFERQDVDQAQEYLYLEHGLFDPDLEGGYGLHQSIGVGRPAEDTHTYSFGADGLVDYCTLFHGNEGVVYSDTAGGGQVAQAVRVTTQEATEIRAYLESQLEARGPYGVLGGKTCVGWSRHQWNLIITRWGLLGRLLSDN